MAYPFALRPSAASRWVKCGGYIKMAAAHPERPAFNLVREEGNVFHSVAASYAKGQAVPREGEYIGKIEVSGDMLDHVIEYTDEMRSWGVPVFVEHPITCPDIHAQCGGTPDAYGICRDRRKVFLLDAKYGYRPHDPFEHLQLGCYLSGVLTSLGVNFNGLHEQYWEVENIIYQPRGRAGGFRRHTFNIAEYGRGLFNILRHSAHRAMSADATLTAGPHCLECEAAASCPALHRSGYSLLDVVDVTQSDILTDVELGHELNMLERAEAIIEARRKALESEAEHRLFTGTGQVPGYMLGATNPRWKWKEGMEEQAIIMAEALGKPSIRAAAKAITPTQARKLIGDALVEEFAEKPKGTMKLKRITASEIKKAFA